MALYSAGSILGGTPQALAGTSSYKTLLTLTCPATTRRFRVLQILMGALGVPTDAEIEWDLSRCTTVGTGGTTVVALPYDPNDVAANTVGTANQTGEPTYTAASNLIFVPANARASYQWNAPPQGGPVTVATNASGLGFRARSQSGTPAAYTGTTACTILFDE